MNCKHVYLYICDNLDADLNSRKCRMIRKHLAACPDCTAYLDSMKRTIALYRMVPVPTLPVAAHRELFKTIDHSWKTGHPAPPAGRKQRSKRG